MKKSDKGEYHFIMNNTKDLIFFPNYKVMRASEALEEFNNLYMAYSHQVKLKNYKKAHEIAQALDDMKKHIEFYEERYGTIKIHKELKRTFSLVGE